MSETECASFAFCNEGSTSPSLIYGAPPSSGPWLSFHPASLLCLYFGSFFLSNKLDKIC